MGARTGWPRIPLRRRAGTPYGDRRAPTVSVHARLRMDRRSGDLLRRLQPGDIAVLNQVDLDAETAQALVERSVSAVLNVATSISGRYPALGPEVLLGAGIPLVDRVDPAVFGRVVDGERLHLEAGALYRGETLVARGTPRDAVWLDAATAEARASMAVQLEALAASARESLLRDGALLLDGVGVPRTRTRLAGRHVLLAVRGRHLRTDVAQLRAYLREYRPVLVAVDEAAEELLATGYRPHIVVGDLATLSERVLACGAELVAHPGAPGPVRGLDRARQAGQEPAVMRDSLSATAAAMVLVDTAGADVIVPAGAHRSLSELLDAGRGGGDSTFLAQLRAGGKLVDARALRRLYRSRVSGVSLVILVVAALLVVVVAGYSTPVGQLYLESHLAYWETVRSWIGGVIP